LIRTIAKLLDDPQKGFVAISEDITEEQKISESILIAKEVIEKATKAKSFLLGKYES
jgi:hypothetical protein